MPKGPESSSLPAAMAPANQAFFRPAESGPDSASLPNCYGFSVLAKVKSGREEAVRAYGRTIEEEVDQNPCLPEPLRLHYLRWILFQTASGLHFLFQGIFDIGAGAYPQDALTLFVRTGFAAIFANLEGWPDDWQTNPVAVIEFFRDHHCPSFLEYGEYPHMSEEEVMTALGAPATKQQ